MKLTSNQKTSVPNTLTLDNDTIVEVLKHLNYCQLASSSLVSKEYRRVIQKNRHKLALLKVDYIAMKFVVNDHDYIKMFDTVLTPEAYKKWVIRNHYLRQIPLESQINETQITQFYQLWACTNYKVYHPIVHAKYSNDLMTVFYANAELSREGWPSFLHFARLLTDPFIYIRDLELISQNVLNLLAEAIKPDHNGVKCDNLRLNIRDNSHAIFTWIKDHVLCNEFGIVSEFESVSNYGEEFLDLFMTGANCTSTIWTGNFDLCDVVVDFVEKFKDLKCCDENRLVESIQGNVLNRSVEMKRSFAELIAKEEEDHRSNTHIFEFVNNDIGKKLVLIIENHIMHDYPLSKFSIKINNL